MSAGGAGSARANALVASLDEKRWHLLQYPVRCLDIGIRET